MSTKGWRRVYCSLVRFKYSTVELQKLYEYNSLPSVVDSGLCMCVNIAFMTRPGVFSTLEKSQIRGHRLPLVVLIVGVVSPGPVQALGFSPRLGLALPPFANRFSTIFSHSQHVPSTFRGEK